MDRRIASLLLLAAITVAAACDPASGSVGGRRVDRPRGRRASPPARPRGPTDRPSAPVATPGPGSATPSGGASAVPPSTGPAPSVAPSVAPSATPSSSPAASGSTTGGLKPAPRPGPFAMDLYRTGDFVSEKRVTWCAPAAMQTMINVMTRGADTTTGDPDPPPADLPTAGSGAGRWPGAGGHRPDADLARLRLVAGPRHADPGGGRQGRRRRRSG